MGNKNKPLIKDVSGESLEEVLFIPITKLDVERRLVYGKIAESRPDKSDEAMDYATSKPNFEAWSSDFDKSTGGKSFGNLRVMHTNKVAGKITEPLTFHDDNEEIYAVAKVLDDQEWHKCEEGAYTGFSIGGKYSKRWSDPRNPNVTKYTAVPREVSLVDNPCMHGAKFQLVKADGIEERFFKSHAPSTPAPGLTLKHRTDEADFHIRHALDHLAHAAKTIGEVKDLHAEGGDASDDGDTSKLAKDAAGLAEKFKDEDHPFTAAYEWAKEHGYDEEGAKNIAGAVKAQLGKVHVTTPSLDPATVEKLVEAVVHKIAERKDVNPAEGKDQYGNVEFADAKNKKYPLDTPAHTRAAASYFAMPKNRGKYSAEDQKTIQAKIDAAKKKHGIGDPVEKMAKGGFDTVGQLAYALQSVESAITAHRLEEAAEGDESAQQITSMLEDGCQTLSDALLAMVAEEVKEYREDDSSAEGGLQMSTGAEGLAKGHLDDLKKKAQMVHDHALEMGAECGGDAEKAARAAELKKFAQTDDLQKMEDRLGKLFGDKIDEALTKVAEAHTKQLDDLKKSYEDRIEKLENDRTPAPAKGIRGPADKVVSLAKNADGNAGREPINLEKASPTDLVKDAWRGGGVPFDQFASGKFAS